MNAFESEAVYEELGCDFEMGMLVSKWNRANVSRLYARIQAALFGGS